MNSNIRGTLLWQDSSDTSSDEEEILAIGKKSRTLRNFRQRRDNLNEWNEEEFFVRFRLTKNTVISILQMIENELEMKTQRNKAMTPLNQLLLTLRLFATGNMLVSVGDFSGVHKSTVCRIVKKVSAALAKLAPAYIHLEKNDIRKNQKFFFEIAKFLKIIGALDCTHIKIQSPGGNTAEYFRNRKGYFSLNIQVISDANLSIRNIVARWPGSTHDQTVWENSKIHALFEKNNFNDAILLGDSGYALKKYLLTPIANPVTESEQLYNEAHIRSRNTVERLFGVWKRRFPILSLGIRLNINTAKSLIIACAVLHNIANVMNEEAPPLDPDVPLTNLDEENINIENLELENASFRQPFIAYFSNLLTE